MTALAPVETLRVLMIEDNPGDARLVREALCEAAVPFDLETVDTVARGISKLQSGGFDAALVDLSLPDSQGLETVERVRRAQPDLAMVVMTSLGDERVATRAVAAGAQDFLVKGLHGGVMVPRSIRYAIERHKLQRQLTEAQKLDAVGRLSGSLAHEFNNLMMTVLGYTELLEPTVEQNPDQKELTAEIRRAGERAAAIVRQMMAVGGFKRLAKHPLSLNETLRCLEHSVRAICSGDATAEFVYRASPDAIEFDTAEIANVLSVLATNACEAMRGGGTVTIATGNGELPPEVAARRPGPTSRVTLTVRDDGIGMSKDVRERLFEPFFKTKKVNEGTGLSLAGIYGTLKEFGVDMTVDSREGEGSTFTVYFPPAPGTRGDDR
ncbi:MAG TPA: ATP-binding protein [Vicinamibacterales bacterium]|nr:ATP-binding protein [Vicinamibacterales bacterium]